MEGQTNMPFPMVHLIISEKLNIKKQIDDFPQYYLGILAPDAYLRRMEYIF